MSRSRRRIKVRALAKTDVQSDERRARLGAVYQLLVGLARRQGQTERMDGKIKFCDRRPVSGRFPHGQGREA